MGTKDLHKEPFDEATLAKLALIEAYVEEWLPTFIVLPYFKEINIFDLFAGPGYDISERPGSPIILLKVIKKFRELLEKNPTKIRIYLNEFIRDKFESLEVAVETFLNENPSLTRFIELSKTNLDFNICFDRLKGELGRGLPNLLLLDQNGIKWVNESRFKEVINFPKTDFLFFISSAHFKRFSEQESFAKHLKIDSSEIKNKPFRFIHRIVLEHYREILPSDSKVRLYPFSLKKGNNFHGLIFGTAELLACEKFLKKSWKMNPINGEANYDIDEDLHKEKEEELLFPALRMKTKVEYFQEKVEKKILSGEIKDNLELYLFTINSAHVPEHSRSVLKSLKEKKKIDFSGQAPAVSYDAWKSNNLRKWQLL